MMPCVLGGIVATTRRYLLGEHPRLGALTVLAVGIATASLLVPFGLLEIGVSGPSGRLAFAVAFGVLPGVAGGICGWYRLGLPAAVGSGIAPGIAFLFVVAVGAALDLGSFGGGDSPLGPFVLTLTAPGFAFATAGFALAVAITAIRGRIR